MANNFPPNMMGQSYDQFGNPLRAGRQQTKPNVEEAPAVQIFFQLPQATVEIQLMSVLDKAVNHFLAGFPSEPMTPETAARAVRWLHDKYNSEK